MMQPGDFTWMFGIGMVFAFMDAVSRFSVEEGSVLTDVFISIL